MRTPLAIRLPEPMVEQIDAIASARLDQPDRSAVIRELLAEALQARQAKGKKR
jgi:metal-responsive CopG/Arc/MetJ family transcriptional regulator